MTKYDVSILQLSVSSTNFLNDPHTSTKIAHHRNTSVLHLTQNLFNKNKFARTISLNSHCLVLFKNLRDAGQFATFARQIYPNCWQFAVKANQDATKDPYLLVDRSMSAESKHFPG